MTTGKKYKHDKWSIPCLILRWNFVNYKLKKNSGKFLDIFALAAVVSISGNYLFT